MRTPAERGPFGQRLVDERTARGWTQKEMLAYLESVGLRLAPSVYASYESGSQRPQAARREAIEALLTRTNESASGSGDTLPLALSGLYDRLDRQAELLTALVGGLPSLEDLEARLRAVEATQRLLHPELVEQAPSTRPVPHARAG